jgi:hypothetical protein
MVEEWDILRKLRAHTLSNGGAILSFIILFWLTKHGVPDGMLRAVLDGIEGVVLIVLILIFSLRVIYDVLPEQIRDKIQAFFTSKFVFA